MRRRGCDLRAILLRYAIVLTGDRYLAQDIVQEVLAALDATARLWGSAVQQHGDVYRLDDPAGATIALAAPQGGERERPCEIVTPVRREVVPSKNPDSVARLRLLARE